MAAAIIISAMSNAPRTNPTETTIRNLLLLAQGTCGERALEELRRVMARMPATTYRQLPVALVDAAVEAAQ